MAIQHYEKKFVIRTFVGTHHPINEKQHQALAGMGANEMVGLENGSQLNTSSIAFVLPADEYYRKFPDDRIVQPAEPIKFPEPINYTKERRIRIIKTMIRTMEGYIAGPKYKGTTGPHNLLKTMNKRLAEVEAEAGNVAKPFNPLTEIYGGHA